MISSPARRNPSSSAFLPGTAPSYCNTAAGRVKATASFTRSSSCFWERERLPTSPREQQQAADHQSYPELYLIPVIKFRLGGDLKRTGKGMCCVLGATRSSTARGELIGVFQLSSLPTAPPEPVRDHAPSLSPNIWGMTHCAQALPNDSGSAQRPGGM